MALEAVEARAKVALAQGRAGDFHQKGWPYDSHQLSRLQTAACQHISTGRSPWPHS